MSKALRRRKAKGGRRTKKEGAVEEIEEEVKQVEQAVVKEVKKAEKAIERKGGKPRAPHQRPPGRAPLAMVQARHGTGMITRQGRGFSLGELAGVGLQPGLAAKWGVRVDARRRSVLDGNVGSLKAWHSHAGAAEKVEGEVRKLGEEMEEAGEEVEREAAVVEKEAVKAEKAVKKEAEKVEKASKKKVKNPKARPKKKS